MISFAASELKSSASVRISLGHRNIQHAVRYTELASGRFNGFWSD
jgi:hypothetical protein